MNKEDELDDDEALKLGIATSEMQAMAEWQGMSVKLRESALAAGGPAGLGSALQGSVPESHCVYTAPDLPDTLCLLLNADRSQCHCFLAGTGRHHQLKEPAPASEVEVETTGAATTMSAVMIGSRPPRCEGRCALCGRCEAVQVPVAPRDKRAAAAGNQHFRLSRAFGGDGVDESSTNYKPLNWRCRCADRRVLNP
ncbi:hypothetical protein ACQ4PT_013702 [Festuca glaucescens]